MKNKSKYQSLTNFQKTMLINAHMAKFIFNAIGGAIALYFLWQKDLLPALVYGGIPIVLGTLISRFLLPFDAQKIAQTFLGKIFLCYSQGAGLIFYLASHILIPISFWLNNLPLAGFGIVVLLVGLLFSLEKYFGPLTRVG